MIDYIIFGEFDINEGNVVRIEYPNKIGISDMILSSYIIPEGTHNIMTDSFCFIVNKPNNPEEILLSKSKCKLEKLFQNSTKFLNMDKSLKSLKVENKIYKIRQVYLFDQVLNEWNPLQNLESDLIKDKKSPQTSKNSGLSNGKSEKEKMTKKIYMILQKDKNFEYFNFDFYESSQENFIYSSNTPPPVISIPIHIDIQFKKLKSNFSSFYTLNSQAFGIEFEDFDINILEKLFENEAEIIGEGKIGNSVNYYMDDYSNYLNEENSSGQKELYFFCHLQTILNKSSKRGAILKSISIGTSKLINLHNFTSLAKYLLDQIFNIHLHSSLPDNEKLLSIKKLIQFCYEAFNKLPADLFIIPNNTRSIEAFLRSSSSFYSPKLTSFEDFLKFKPQSEINQITLEISVTDSVKFSPIVSENQEHLFPDCIENFISIFKDNTMVIYDALLTDRKIMFIGEATTPCETLSKFVFTCASLFPVFGISKRLNPYKNLYDLEFLNSSNCVYAVTNPIFKMKNTYWDIMCDVETGQISFGENYKKIYNSQNKESDHFFIREVLYKIKNEYISEYEIKRYFNMYTAHLLKLANEQYFIDDDELNNEINKQYKRKISLINSFFVKFENEMDKLREHISSQGVSLKIVNKYLDSLLYRKNINKEELFLIYSDINKFLDNEYNINWILSFIVSNMQDIHIFLSGLFSKHREIAYIVKEICSKLEKSTHGAILMKKLNYLYILRLNELETHPIVNLNNEANVDSVAN